MPLLPMATFKKIAAIHLPSFTAPDHQTWLATTDWQKLGHWIHFIVLDKQPIHHSDFLKPQINFLKFYNVWTCWSIIPFQKSCHERLGTHCSLCYFFPQFPKNGDHLVFVASLFMKASMQSVELKNGQCYIHVNSWSIGQARFLTSICRIWACPWHICNGCQQSEQELDEQETRGVFMVFVWTNTG